MTTFETWGRQASAALDVGGAALVAPYTGGVTVNDSPSNRIGSRYVEVTVIGSTGKLLK